MEYIFHNFWTWLGFIIILTTVLNFLLKCYNSTLRHWNIRKHGYPPPHCDADGDLLANMNCDDKDDDDDDN